MSQSMKANSDHSARLSEEDPRVTTFRNYLRIKTAHPDPDYGAAVAFLQKLADGIELPNRVVEIYPNKPALIISWEGKEPNLPAVMLSSHMDVAPIYGECWKYDPFGAHKSDSGYIFGRGAQDMKSVGIQYMEAIRELKQGGKSFRRTIHVVFVPEKEHGCRFRMKEFVQMKEFKELNIGFALDGGVASPYSNYFVFNSERLRWHLKVTCRGTAGHASSLLDNTAAEKLNKVLNSLFAFREEQFDNFTEANSAIYLGQVTTLNLVKISGGHNSNTIPTEIVVEFDIRVPPTTDLPAMKTMLENLVTSAGIHVEVDWIAISLSPRITSTSDKDKWWRAFSGALSKTGRNLLTAVYPGGSDAHFLRNEGIPVLGFSPMPDTPILMHDHNECLNESTFLHGIDVYKEVISALIDVQ